MKKILSIVLAALLTLSTVFTAASCGEQAGGENGGNGGDANASSNEGGGNNNGGGASVSVGKGWENDENLPISNEDVVTTLEAAIKNTLNRDHISINLEGKAVGSIRQQGLTADMNIPVSGYLKANLDDTKNPQLGFKLEAKTPEFVGGNITSQMYVEDGIMYVVQDSGSYQDSYQENVGELDVNELREEEIYLPSAITDFLDGTHFVTRNDGSKSVTVDIDASMISELTDIPEENIDIERFKIKITLKNDILSRIDAVGELTLNMPVSYGLDPLPIVLGFEASAVCETPDTKVSIEPPADYKSFESYGGDSKKEESEDDSGSGGRDYYYDSDYYYETNSDSTSNSDAAYDYYYGEAEVEAAPEYDYYGDYYYGDVAVEAEGEAAEEEYNYYYGNVTVEAAEEADTAYEYRW